MTDKEIMKLAWEMANKCEPPYQFGSAVVKDGKIVGLDHNRVGEIPDTSAHAEVSAIRKACKELGVYHLEGYILYSTHEPCIMCFACVMWAGFDKVVYQVPKEEQDDFMYASSLSVEDFNDTALRSNIKIERYEP